MCALSEELQCIRYEKSFTKLNSYSCVGDYGSLNVPIVEPGDYVITN